MRRMQARATLTGHAPGRGAIAPDSSRASLRPSSSALGPGFRVYAAVSSAILRRQELVAPHYRGGGASEENVIKFLV